MPLPLTAARITRHRRQAVVLAWAATGIRPGEFQLRPQADDPRETLRGRMRLFIAFCVADPVRYQMVFERPVPGFEPAPESFHITAAALAGTRADMQAAGVAGEPALDMFRALITGLVSLQVANDAGGDRWTRLQDDAFDMFFAHYAGGNRNAVQPAGKAREQSMDTSRQPPAASTADAFDQSHQGRIRSTVVEQIYRSAFGADYPAGAHPSAFYSAATLQLAVNALQLRPGNVVADLGCGHGGPGLWAARQTGATLIGIDLSPAGIELARRQATQLGLDGQARFLVGDLTATGLPDASCDAVISLDVLLFVPGKAAAREIARILRPGGRLAFTTWERLAHPAGDDPQRRALAGTCHDHPCCNPPEPTTASSSKRQALPSRRTRNRQAGGPSSRRSRKASSPPRRR